MAPTDALGKAATMVAALGKNARATISTPSGKAIARLVVPAAREIPMLLDEVFCPIPPSRPEIALPKPLVNTPPLTDFMSVRFHPTSLIFWQRVVSPTVFKLAVRAAIRKGGSRASLKENPAAAR